MDSARESKILATAAGGTASKGTPAAYGRRSIGIARFTRIVRDPPDAATIARCERKRSANRTVPAGLQPLTAAESSFRTAKTRAGENFSLAIARDQSLLVAYRAFSDVAGKGAFFLVTIMAARRLSHDAFAVFALGTTIGWIASVASDFGMQLHLARAVAREPHQARRLLRAWLRVRVLTSAIAMAAIAATLAVWRPASFAGALTVFAFAYLVSGLVEFLHYFYRGLGRSDIESTLTLWQRFAVLVCAAFALSWRPTATALAVAMAVPAVAAFLYSRRRAAKLAGAPVARTPGTDDRPMPINVGDVVPIGAGIVLSALYFRIDIFLLERWSGTSAVALYGAVFRLVEALRLFPAAVLAVALPWLCRAAGLRPLAQVAGVLVGFSLVTTAVVFFLAEWIVRVLYGTAYADAVPAFRVLLLSFPLMSLNYALTHQLIGWDGHRSYAALCAAALVFNVGLNARLIPELSMSGAAWATLFTEVLLTIGCAGALWLNASRRRTPAMSAAVAP
jgi:O-antigen/teichoic acid export membrane protein